MAQDFLEEIYKDAMVIEHLQEYVAHINAGRDWSVNVSYNKAAVGLEQIIHKLAMNDVPAAQELQGAVLQMLENYTDRCFSKGMVEGNILPRLFHYMAFYSGIEVEEGRYLLKSADSAFLTVKDLKQDVFLHDIHDPMQEAYRMAESMVKPEMNRFLIFGCGLGYLAYQIWAKVDGAIKIVIYEDDAEILQYSQDYGVLSWIPDKDIELIHIPDIERLSGRFINDLNHAASSDQGFYISVWKWESLRAAQDGAMYRLIQSTSLERMQRDWTIINCRRNLQRAHVRFSDIKEKIQYSSWISVAAGPSLDEQLDFIRDSAEDFGIIAVNTVLKRITDEGIIPDVVVAADQDVLMAKHLEGVELPESVPLIADCCASWKYVELFHGPVCYVRLNNFEVRGERRHEMENWKVNGTVASLAIEAALRLGAKKLYFAGQDLAFPGGRNYAGGMPHETKEGVKGSCRVLSTDGGMVDTTDGFNLFRQAIEQQIAEHPEVKFYNLSKHGALIHGAEFFDPYVAGE